MATTPKTPEQALPLGTRTGLLGPSPDMQDASSIRVSLSAFRGECSVNITPSYFQTFFPQNSTAALILLYFQQVYPDRSSSAVDLQSLAANQSNLGTISANKKGPFKRSEQQEVISEY